MESKTLCELFAVPPSTLSRVLTAAENALHLALQCIPAARVTFPSRQQQRHWAKLTNAKEPDVSGVFGFVDGKNLRVQEPTSIDLQNAHYNGLLYSSLG
jgi:hypothetical protein